MEYAFIGGSMGWSSARKSPARSSARGRAPSRRDHLLLGRRAHEGRGPFPDADGEDLRRARAVDRARLPYISVLTDPTTGGVTASFAMLGDLNIAEPKALIGFAGPRVIEQTIRQKLPEGFQRSEFLLEKGMIDLIVDRREMKAVVANALRFMGARQADPLDRAGLALMAAPGDGGRRLTEVSGVTSRLRRPVSQDGAGATLQA